MCENDSWSIYFVNGKKKFTRFFCSWQYNFGASIKILCILSH